MEALFGVVAGFIIVGVFVELVHNSLARLFT